MKIFLGGLWVQIQKLVDYFKFKPPRSDFTASDWSRAVFGFGSDTDVAERRRIAQNSSFDSNISKKNKKKIFVKKWVKTTYLGLNVKTPLNHTIWGSFESSWTPENRKNNEHKNCVQKMVLWRHVVKISEIAIERQNGGQIESSWVKNIERMLINI